MSVRDHFKSNKPKRLRGHYGALKNNPNRPRVVLKPKPDVTLNPPPSVDFYSSVPAASWGMLANGPDATAGLGPNYAGCGDCTCAGAGHLVDLVAWFAQSNTPAPVTSVEVLAAYEKISGYSPSTGRNDNGAELQQVLQYWTKNPIAGYSPSGFAQIDITNVDLVKSCIDYFGAVYSGFAVPAIFETQFDQGQPWDVPKGRQGSQIEGGHCVPVVGYTADATGALEYWIVITWGAVQKVTPAAFAKYWGSGSQGQGEGWVAVLPQWMEASGKTPSGLDTATANSDFQSLTGSTESPFPTVTPTPVPTPTPTPTPTPASATALLTQIQNDLVLVADQATTLAAQVGAFLAANPPGGDTPPHHHGH